MSNIKPYYDEDGIVIYLGDCLDILPQLGKVDLVLTDPPYGINYKHGGGTYANAPTVIDPIIGDDKPFNPDFLPKPYMVWGANHYHLNLDSGGRWLVWDKREDVIPQRDQADCEIAWCSDDGVDRLYRHYWDGFNKKTERGIPRQHPTQKPIRVMAWTLSFFPDAQTILDPFMGSGTTGVACANLGRKFIGVEIEEKYFTIACERIEAAYAQGRLFE